MSNNGANMRDTILQKRFYTGIAFVILTGVLLYFRSLGFHFVWDDKLLIVNNYWITSGAPLGEALTRSIHLSTYWRPLTVLSFYMNYQIAGLSPWVFHATQLFLHAVVIFLVIVWALLVTGKRDVALLAGLLFALHPMVSETVCFISARCNIFATIGFLGALIGGHLIFADRIRMGCAVYAVSAFIGIWAKESGVLILAIPAIYWGYAVISRGGVAGAKSLLKPCIVSTLLGALFAAIYWGMRILVIQNIDTGQIFRTEGSLLLDIIYRIPYWAGQILMPVFSKSDYRFLNSHLTTYQVAISAVAIVSILTGIVFLWRKKQWQWLLNAFLFMMVISPFLGFVSTRGRSFSESWLYMALPFFALPVAFLFSHAFSVYGKRSFVTVLLVGVITAYSALSFGHMAKWQTQETLVMASLKADPENPKNILGYGILQVEKGDFKGAKKTYWHIINNMPEYEKTYDFLALLYLEEKDFKGAETVARLGLKNADIKDRIYGVLATILMQTNRLEEARAVLAEAPDSLKFKEKKRLQAAVLLQMGRTDEAVKLLGEYVKQYPSDTDAKAFYRKLLQK